MQLTNGSRVVVVGGGPAGSFCALHLLHYAAEAGLRLDVQIFEGRDFSQPGPGSCNMCAGILSATLEQNLRSLGLELPPEVILAELSTYILHLKGQTLALRQPDPARRILSVYRGRGPRLGQAPYPASFDGWLLEQARQRGASVHMERVQSIQPGGRPRLCTAHGDLDADLVVLATGVNRRPPLHPAWGYRPPRSEQMAQDEVPWPSEEPGDSVHIFFDYPPGLIFGAIIPKRRYANISLLGRGLGPDAMQKFIAGQRLGEVFAAEMPRLCGCAPRVAVSAARGYYADRLVVVGDAAVTRLYKDGMGAAFTTAQAAAQTAVQRGVARRDFAAGYQPTCRRIAWDNRYGQLLFGLWGLVRRIPGFMELWQRPILTEVDQPPSSHIYTRVLWSMFTGDEPYRKIFWSALSRPALFNLWKRMVQR